MKFSSIAILGALMSLSAANHVQTTNIEVDVVCTDVYPSTVTTTVTVTAPAVTATGSSLIKTVDGTVTSYDYSGSLTTVYVWPTGSASRDITVVVYEELTVIQVSIINVNVVVNNGVTSTITTTKTEKPTFTPPPAQSTTSQTESTSTGTRTSTAARQTHTVQVGALGELIYGPNQLNAALGDIVRFDFLKLNHSVTQSSFAKPCTYNGGFDTGLNQFNPKNISGKFLVDFQVNTTAPLWFYCKQNNPASHCHKGMVLGVNPQDKFATFLANAEAQGVNKTISARQPMVKGRRAASWLA